MNSVMRKKRIKLDNKNGSNCKTWNIVQFAKMWMQFKNQGFPYHYKRFFTVPKPNEQKKIFCYVLVSFTGTLPLTLALRVGVSRGRGLDPPPHTHTVMCVKNVVFQFESTSLISGSDF